MRSHSVSYTAQPPAERARIVPRAAAATLLHNNLGGVAGHYCATEGGGCSSDLSQLGDVGTYPGCAGKALHDMCYTGMGARWPPN